MKPKRRITPRGTTRAKQPFIRAANLMSADDLPNYADMFPEVDIINKRLFLQGYAATGRIDAAARAAGVTPGTTLAWRRDASDVVFQAAWEQAVVLSIEGWEAELARRGFKGVEKPMFYRGQMVATTREYDTTAAIFMLKGARPEKYRDNVHWSGAGPQASIDININAVDDAHLEQRMRELVDMLQPQALPASTSTIDAAPILTPEEEAYQQALADRRAAAINVAASSSSAAARLGSPAAESATGVSPASPIAATADQAEAKGPPTT